MRRDTAHLHCVESRIAGLEHAAVTMRMPIGGVDVTRVAVGKTCYNTKSSCDSCYMTRFCPLPFGRVVSGTWACRVATKTCYCKLFNSYSPLLRSEGPGTDMPKAGAQLHSTAVAS